MLFGMLTFGDLLWYFHFTENKLTFLLCFASCIYQPYCHLHVYNSIKIMVGTFVSTIILSLHQLNWYGLCYAPRLSAPLTLITQHLQGAEKHLAASLLPHLLVYFWVFSSSSSRSVIFRRLMPRVDPLCSNAEVVGGSTPATPSAISARLKPTMKR